MVPKSMFIKSVFLLFGVFCGSTAVIMIKASSEHPFLVASFRLIIASIALSPFYLRELGSFQGNYGWKQIGWSTLPALALAIHFMSWVVGARMTYVANASLIANLTPVAMPFFLWVFFKEKIYHGEVVGTLFSLGGLTILAGANFQLSRFNFTGDIICFGSMLAFACYLALGRKNSHRLSLWLYMIPLYLIAGLVCLGCALPIINPIKSYTQENLLYILGLGLVPTVFGHTILNYSMKFFRGQVVSVINLTQPIFAGILGFLMFKEIPRPIFLLAAFFILLGVLVVLFSSQQRLKIKAN